METQQRSTEYNFQGIMYFFRREKIQCRYQFSLRDAVDITLLQRALTAALASAPYYTQRLVQEKREMWLEPNTEPCLVYPGSTMRNIPEQTNGYLFCVSCEGDTVYFDWHHFLLDGHGVSPCSPAFWSSTATCVTARPLRCRRSCATRPMIWRPCWQSTRLWSTGAMSSSGMWCRPTRVRCAAPGCA